MKLEWGKKVNCPTCALPFYNLQKSSLLCPHCGDSFEVADLQSKRGMIEIMDEVDFDSKLSEITGFDFPDEADSGIGLVDDTGIIAVGDDIEDVKIVD
ncbi:MAG: FYDLN acid domain-containing protein [Holosporales bacterium]|jgi:hypothetical protein|nr:FYDLN acid domain-containing protein [Holosporales bacterium]